MTSEKGCTARWTEEVFSLSEIQHTSPVTYKINDECREIQDTFYEQELQKVNQEVFRIEKIIKKEQDKSLVKWLGYPDSSNSQVNSTNEMPVGKFGCNLEERGAENISLID